jgi:hypothetical protein
MLAVEHTRSVAERQLANAINTCYRRISFFSSLLSSMAHYAWEPALH